MCSENLHTLPSSDPVTKKSFCHLYQVWVGSQQEVSGEAYCGSHSSEGVSRFVDIGRFSVRASLEHTYGVVAAHGDELPAIGRVAEERRTRGI